MFQTISLFAPQLVLAFFASQLLSTGAFAKRDISIGVRNFSWGIDTAPTINLKGVTGGPLTLR